MDPATMDRFVVGTGRCGSTLLSRMLAEHREVVSIHELFTGLDWGRRFAPGPVSGAALAELLASEQPVTTEVLRRGHTSDEIRYPFGAPQATRAPGDPVPWILITMLSRLSEDPEPLYEEVLTWAAAQPERPLPDHYRTLFGWLARRCGGSLWVERSGSSLDYLTDLVAAFPAGRFVHLHRDGHEAALSIREHPFFRLGVAVLLDLFPPDLDPDAQVTAVIDTPPPLWAVGRFWSDQVLRGYRALPQLDRDQFLDVRFEDLLADPAHELERIDRFFELPPDARFVDRAAALLGAPPVPRFPSLPPEDQRELADACRPGQLLLNRVPG
jgi:hypothetical protein